MLLYIVKKMQAGIYECAATTVEIAFQDMGAKHTCKKT